jgi:hypothetical protein
MLYIMQRTQLYLDYDLWNVLHTRARRERTTISDLVRQAVRQRYLGNLEQRRQAMQALVGIRKAGPSDSADSVRNLRRDRRSGRLETP